MAVKCYSLGKYTPKGRLPKNVYVRIGKGEDLEDDEDLVEPDDVVDILSDTYGFCIQSCNVYFSTSVKTGNKIAYANNIVWDKSE